MFPIHHAQAFGGLPPLPSGRGAGCGGLAFGDRDRDAFFEEFVDLAVGRLKAHRRAVACEFVDGRLDRLGWQARVELGQCNSQALHEHHFAFGLATERAGCAEGFIRCRSRLPAEGRKEPDGGLFDELVFGVEGGFHRGASTTFTLPSRSSMIESRKAFVVLIGYYLLVIFGPT